MAYRKLKNYGAISDLETVKGSDSRGVSSTESINHGLEVSEESTIKDEEQTKTKSRTGTLPINKAGIISYMFVLWFSPLVWRMFRNRGETVSEGDIWQTSEEESVQKNTERIQRIWKAERNKGVSKASFYRVWTKFIRARVVAVLLMITMVAVSTFLSSAYLVNVILTYLESEDGTLLYGIGLSAAVLACEFVRVCSLTDLMIYGAQTGARFRSGMNGLIYQKLLRVRSLDGKTVSEIMNIFSLDSYRVYYATQTAPWLLSVPIYLVIGAGYCYWLISYWSFVAIATFIVCYLLQVSLSKVLQTLRRQCVKFTDTRVRCMGEILNSMKFIKMYGWEQPFKDEIEAERKKEQKYLLYSAIVSAITGSIIPVTPTIASVVTITVYRAAGNALTAPTTFAVIGTMNFLRMVVALIPTAMRSYAEAKVSLERVTKMLLLNEHSAPSSNCIDKTCAIEVKAANFAWDGMSEVMATNQSNDNDHKTKQTDNTCTDNKGESSAQFTLTNINMDVKEGQLIGICGSVGSGKSSLMAGILGRIRHLKGHVAVRGTVAYVAQQAWIVNETIKENILFGLEYDYKRYKDVIRCCGLETDLQLFDNGDETEIGERGSNLSGGQKQRVNLARAAYSNSDIYILDDPMSALDVRVGKQIFHSCIRGLLKDKTILLVTHQLQYLKHCDEVVVMKDGCVAEQGKHEELLQQNRVYTEMYKVYENTTMKSQKKNQSKDDSETTNSVEKESYHFPPEATTDNVKESYTETKETVKGKLVQTEEASVGTVTLKTYNAYIKAAGGWAVAVVVMALHVVAAGSLVFSDWWLSQWITSSSDQQTHTGTNGTLRNTTKMPSVRDALPTTTKPEGLVMNLDYDTYFLVYITSLAGILLFQVLKGCAGAKASISASGRLHHKCLGKIMKAPMSFFDSNPTGRVLNRFSKDLDEGDVFIPQVTNELLQVLWLIILSFAMASYVTPWILIAIVPIIAVFYFLKVVSLVSTRQIKRIENVSRSPLLSHVNVTSQGLSTITAYRQQDTFYKKCVSLVDVASLTIFLFDVSIRWIGIRLDLMAASLTVGASLIFVLTKGLIPAASAGLVFSLCGKTVSTIQFVVRLMNEAEARFTSIERLNEYRKSLTSEAQHGSQPFIAAWPTEGSVEFRNVTMRYRPEMDPVLRSVSFVIKSREKIGVVGRTGAGKSSLAVSLFRLVELSEGAILIDDQDISTISLHELRSRISTIPQDPVLFSGTIRYNIDPFSKFSDDDIWRALEKVHMKEKILHYDESLDVSVDQNGENFSVGERQLICLGRAVLRSSKILLLDEATANIDTSTDAMIQETIRTCFADCTVITIAHRLNTVLHSDKIIVMDAGQASYGLCLSKNTYRVSSVWILGVPSVCKVLECASPEELLSDPSSFFNKMISAQTVKTSPF